MGFAENNPNGSINSNQLTVSEKVAAKALDPAFIEEQKRIFKNSWVPVCHESELPEPYDFRTSSIGNENIIICRAPDGKINALLNVCPHRECLSSAARRAAFSRGRRRVIQNESLACFTPGNLI